MSAVFLVSKFPGNLHEQDTMDVHALDLSLDTSKLLFPSLLFDYLRYFMTLTIGMSITFSRKTKILYKYHLKAESNNQDSKNFVRVTSALSFNLNSRL